MMKSKQASKIGLFVIAEMKRQKITMKEMEKRSGISRSAICDWYRYGTSPYFANVQAVLSVLGYDLVWKKTESPVAGKK